MLLVIRSDLGEQTLHYYLKVFSITLIFFLLFFSCYSFFTFNKNLLLVKNSISIKKGENIDGIIKTNIKNLSFVDLELIKIYLRINQIINKKFIHYGDFKIHSDDSLFDFIRIITNPSNILTKITIVEGWSKKQLDLELSKYFKDYYSIPFNSIIADTYFIKKNGKFETFVERLKNIKTSYFIKKKKNKLFNEYNQNEIMIVASLIEKEGLDNFDKKLISSVIFNRLNKKMKLQIDATVLYSITNGNYDLERKLLLRDLKIDHPFNTYKYKGLPPKPISYVGKKTLDLLFENHKTEFLFYFFNNSLNKHIFSKNYEEHKKKLYEYRKK